MNQFMSPKNKQSKKIILLLAVLVLAIFSFAFSTNSVLASTGTFTSSIKDQGVVGNWGSIVFNTTLNGGTVTMKVRTSNSATMSGAPDWSTCSTITSGTNITGTNCAASPARYAQYQATLNLGTSSPSLDDVAIAISNVSSSPSQVTGLSATAGNAQVVLSWSAPFDNGSAITSYKVYRGTASNGETLLAAGGCSSLGNVLTCTDAGLAGGTAYYYKVSAVNSIGEGSQSSEASATPAAVPSQVTGLSATAGNAQVALSWTAPANNGSAITSYKVYRGASSNGETLLAAGGCSGLGNVLTCTDAGLANGTAYYYKVSAVNGVGEGSLSAEVNATPHIPGYLVDGYTFIHRRPITLSPATSTANYQVNVVLTASNFNYANMSYPVTGQDLRFTGSDGTTVQNYWIESWVNGGTSSVWVNVIASGTSSIYMYYGNSSATSSSNLTNVFGTSTATSAIPGCTLGQACIVSSNQTISTSGTYGHPYIRINSGVTLNISGDNVIVYFDSIGRFDIKGTLTSVGGGAGGATNTGGTPGGTYWGTGSGGNGGRGGSGANGNSGYVGGGGSYGGGGASGQENTGCGGPGSFRGGSYGGGGAGSSSGCQNCSSAGTKGAFLSVKAGILNISSSGSLNINGINDTAGCGSAGGGSLFEANASTLFIHSGTISATGGNGASYTGGAGGEGGGGGTLVYINYPSMVGLGSITLTSGNGQVTGPWGGGGSSEGGTATLITPAGTQIGSPSGTTGGTTSKTYSTGGSEPAATVGAEQP